MGNHFILAITGPAGAGKSTVVAKLAEQIEQCVNIDADHVKHFIVNSFVYGNTPAGVPQWQLLGTNVGMLAHNFQAAGYNVIINGYLNEPAWHEIQKHVQLTHKLLLLPHVDKVIARDAGRQKEVMIGAATIRDHHDYFSSSRFYHDFARIDSTEHTVDESVRIIKALLT